MTTFHISKDKVDAPIFYRAVPLPFKFARENLKRIRWHFGHVNNENQPHAVLENIPVCANCHSFTPDGSTLVMDVDARDDKGAYTLTSFEKATHVDEDSLIHWSDYQNGKFTYGLLSQISPDGRYVVSTLKDCEIFVDRNDLAYSQLFFPVKGILVVYDRLNKKYFELEGANDTTFIQSNPCWTPDGKYIYFSKAPAEQYEESGLKNGSVPKDEDIPHYKIFEEHFLKRDSLKKFNIYKIPFNNGKGGKAVPVEGASHNGFSNYFPKISPDGKWLVFCQAESFMLLQKDSKLNIVPANGGEARELTCNSDNMNSWHSWSPNSKWLVYSSKQGGPYTQLYLTHIDENGLDTPPVFLENFSFDKYANNIPEFVNTTYDDELKIDPAFLSENDFIVRIGEIKQRKGDLNGAFAEFDKAVKKFPNQSEPYFKRGVVYFIKGEMINAIADITRAIEIDEMEDYFTYRGLAYLKLGKNEQVVNDLKRALKLDPRSFTACSYMGVAYVRQGNYNAAIEILERANTLFNEDALTYFYLGLSYFNTENWKKSEDSLTAAINLGIKNSAQNPVYSLRGEARFYQNNYDEAVKDLQIAVTTSPNDHQLFYLLGKAQLETGKKREARQNLLKAKQLGSVQAGDLLNTMNV
nr:tetratricopeptide repeat protein [uncultured Draconibacterium sp.]